jgi:cytochrome b subunit of formate dehydrogenase
MRLDLSWWPLISEQMSNLSMNRLLNPLLALSMALCAPLLVARAQSSDECLSCHGDRSLSVQRKGKEVSLFVNGTAFSASVHADLSCEGCHEGFDPYEIPHAAKLKPAPCTTCHDQKEFEQFALSVHGKANVTGILAAGCAGCHDPHTVRSLSDAPLAERHKAAVEMCSKCHAQTYKEYMASDHGRAVAAGESIAPTCIDCHGEHTIEHVTSDSAMVAKKNQAKMCLSCHLDNEEVRNRVGPAAGFVAGYEQSVHGKAIQEGNDAAAICSDCHGSHSIVRASNPASMVNELNIASTCGACHGDIEKIYETSIHGEALSRGILESATCTSCHGEHDILSPSNAASRVSAHNISREVCSPCHESVRLAAKFGFSAERVRSFEDSYHGLASRGGETEVANCASCHGYHDVRPSSDPRSRVYRGNLAVTCGECHPGATASFAKGSVHNIRSAGKEDVLYFISSTYIILILVTIGGMAFHNIVDFVRKSRRQLAYRRGDIPKPHHGHRLYLRMSLGERIQHGLLILSFTTLVVTGFALHYPGAWWVAPFAQWSPSVFELRSLVHRIAGVLLITASLYHLYYIAFVPRGRQLIRDLLPVRKDVTDLVGVLKYNLGLSRQKPLFARFSYIEKSEYWALVWGTAVMALTGIILWFDNTFLNLLTKLGWDVARTIHYFEAWLATLAIIVWHLYFVIFNPDTYPINLAFWKGTLTEEEMAEEHPLELEQLKGRADAEERETAAAAGAGT